MRVLLPLALIFVAESISAQVPQLRRSGIPPDVADRLESIATDARTHRLHGNAEIGPSEIIEGDVYASGGFLRVAGMVRGQLIVVDGDVVFEPGAEVMSDVTIVGGTATGMESVRLGGTFTEYGEGFGWLAQANRIHEGRSRWTDRGWDVRRDLGHVDLDVRVGQNYNRVEGLPLQFGPTLRTGGANPLWVEAFAIWRTAAGSLGQTERMGYLARAEQFVGPHLRVGVSARSIVQPLDPWGVSDLEASLAAAFLHEDQRDYFEREGWSAYLRVTPRHSPLDVIVEYRDERQRTAGVRDPWTLFNGEDIWRLQPLAAEGRLRSLDASVEVDLREGRGFIGNGWYFRSEFERGLDGNLETPVLGAGLPPASGRQYGSDFTTGLLDIRRYEPVGYHGSLALRVVGGGTLQDVSLAPQFQHALGGAGTLPGYDLLSVDCGARSAVGMVSTGIGGAGPSYYGGYGCDRFGLFQAEYRGGFDIRFGDHDDGWRDERWPRHVHANIDWTVFFDAAKGWRFDESEGWLDSGVLYDAGAGVILGDFGVYGAVPLTGDERNLRLFIRLGPRF